MKKSNFFTVILVLSFCLSSCSMIKQSIGGGDCSQYDMITQKFETLKGNTSGMSSKVTPILSKADQSLAQNVSTISSWVSALPRLDMVHFEAQKYLIEAKRDFLSAVGAKDEADKLQRSLDNLKNKTPEEAQATINETKSDQRTNDAIKSGIDKLGSAQSIEKVLLDKAYVRLTYGAIYEAVTIYITTEISKDVKDQISTIVNPSSPADIMRLNCLKSSGTKLVDMTTQGSSNLGEAVPIYNSIVQVYAKNNYDPPKTSTADGKPVDKDWN